MTNEQKTGFALRPSAFRRNVIFTIRQRYLLRRLCQGADTKEIADELEINVGTVNAHIRHMCEMAGVSGDRQLVVFAWQQPSSVLRDGLCKRGLHVAAASCHCDNCRTLLAA